MYKSRDLFFPCSRLLVKSGAFHGVVQRLTGDMNLETLTYNVERITSLDGTVCRPRRGGFSAGSAFFEGAPAKPCAVAFIEAMDKLLSWTDCKDVESFAIQLFFISQPLSLSYLPPTSADGRGPPTGYKGNC